MILPEVLFYFMQGKGVEDMATVYALLIIKARKPTLMFRQN